MPINDFVLELPHFTINRSENGNPIRLYAQYSGENTCPRCGSNHLRNKGKFKREVKHISFSLKKSVLIFEAKRFLCKDCGRYFNQRFDGIQPRVRSSEPLKNELIVRHQAGICLQKLADGSQVSSSTLERWCHQFLLRKIKERIPSFCPRVLGIDEDFFGRKQGFATTFCDLKKHRVYNVELGRSKADLWRYLKDLEGRHRVQVVVIDLSSGYRSMVRSYFPKAKIVCDRFHVIRLVNHHFLNYWKEIDPEGRKNRRLLSLMRRSRQKLTEEQMNKLSEYFSRHPSIGMGYKFRNKLMELFNRKSQNKRQCRRLIPLFNEYIKRLLSSPMAALGKTLRSWDEEIVRMWRFTKTNGITEGLHNKMETISRNAYGYRNFENYRLRVRTLCS